MIHPDELLEQLTEQQLNEWVAWNNISPIGERRADIRSAVMTSHLRAAWVENDRDAEDFLPKFKVHDDSENWEPETEEQLKLQQLKEADQFR